MGRSTRLSMRTGRASAVWLLGLLSAVGCIVAGAARAQNALLPCGVPLARHLSSGAVDSYQLTLAADGTALVEVTDTSGTLGLMKLQVAGRPNASTCRGTLALVGPGNFVVHASDCFGADSGNYTITQNLVSQSDKNCGSELACGATPDGTGFRVPGQVDAFTLTGKQGANVTLNLTDTAGALGRLRIRAFDPSGVSIRGLENGSCAGTVKLVLPTSGLFTVLVDSCGLPQTGPYRLTAYAAACPAGPVITHFGLASADEKPLRPATVDNLERSVYELGFGSGFMLVIEAHPGMDGSPVGTAAFNSSSADTTALPDLQMLASRQLGNGSAEVCDETYPHLGGIPGFFPPEFLPVQAVADAVNDLGCRFDDGTGNPFARGNALDACTRSDQGFGFGFVDRTSTVQFCALVNSGWPFPAGDTILAARIRDAAGNLGARREIVVRVGAAGTPSPTPTPTSTPPPPFTPTPTPVVTRPKTPVPITPKYCVGDCTDSGRVTVDKLLQCVHIALTGSALNVCLRCDANADGRVTIDEVLQAVRNVLNGCPVTTNVGAVSPKMISVK